jgi:hypothetical protein
MRRSRPGAARTAVARGMRGLGDEGSLVGNSAAITCINAQQHIYVNAGISDYLKMLIYDQSAKLTDDQKQWAWSQWQPLQDEISSKWTPQNFSACNASADYAQKAGYSNGDPLTNILASPYQSQLMVDGSGYTVEQTIAIGKQQIDYHLFGSSQFGPDMQGTRPAGIIAYVDIPTHTLKNVAVGVNTGLSPAQIASPSLTPDQQKLYQAGDNAQMLAANNPGVIGPPSVSVPIPAALADNGQIIPGGVQSSSPVPATPSAIASAIDSTVATIPTWEWLAGGAALILPFVLRGLSGLPAVTGIISPYTGQDISSTYHMDPTGIPVPDGNHVGPGGALVADYDPAQISRARGIYAAMATWQANAAHIQAALQQPGLSQAQIQFANSVLAPLLADISTQAHGLIADLPAYAVQDAQAWAASSPSPQIPDTGANSGRTIQQTIDLNNQIFDNQINAYADPSVAANLAAQNAAFTANENSIANAISSALKSGTPYTLPGAAPIPAQYQPQNLPKEPVSSGGGITLPPGGYVYQTPAAQPTKPAPAPTPAAPTTAPLGLSSSLSSIFSSPITWGLGALALLFAFSGNQRR